MIELFLSAFERIRNLLVAAVDQLCRVMNPVESG
jgi:hypothetical protein